MDSPQTDALVFFGATGDLAYKKIFPSLQAMVKRGTLDVPVVGVARSTWSLDQFRAWALDSLEKHGGVDRATFEKLSGLLRYIFLPPRKAQTCHFERVRLPCRVRPLRPARPNRRR